MNTAPDSPETGDIDTSSMYGTPLDGPTDEDGVPTEDGLDGPESGTEGDLRGSSETLPED